MIDMCIYNYSFYDLAFYFFIYSFWGWAMEVSYAALCTGKFVNRGFLNGPVCPIYGLGGVFIIVALTPFMDNAFLLFVCSVLLSSLLEFLTGEILEKIFHTKWWDYSDLPFNLKGYICLKFSIAWGIICLLVMRIIHPLIIKLVSLCPNVVGYILLAIFAILLIIDLSFTVRTILKLKNNFAEVEKIIKKIRLTSDNLGEVIYEETLELKEKIDNKVENSRLLKAFPKLKDKYNLEEILKKIK